MQLRALPCRRLFLRKRNTYLRPHLPRQLSQPSPYRRLHGQKLRPRIPRRPRPRPRVSLAARHTRSRCNGGGRMRLVST